MAVGAALRFLGLLFAASVVLPTSAFAQSDADLVRRFCAGMLATQYGLPDGTEADCISPTHAIEVDKTEHWAESLGQALHYSLWTNEIVENPATFPRWSKVIQAPLLPGIIVVCEEEDRDLCTDRSVRLYRIIEEYRLPITVWDCDLSDLTLADCQILEWK